MLPHTFCHIPGIGTTTERRLWQAGIAGWEQWPGATAPVKNTSAAEIGAFLAQSRQALTGDPLFFTRHLAAAEEWRIFPHFREHTAYIDIETTGLGADAELTTVALYDGREVRVYVSGENLNDLQDDLNRFKVLVSYNGKSFDIPFLERHFRIKLNQAQLDLRYVLARLGGRGGLKGCEKMFGIHRGILDGVDGAFAVTLWRYYQNTQDRRALETLLAYNIEDTVNLERLAVIAYNRNVEATPFAQELSLPYPQPPCLPYQPDLALIEEIRRLGLV